MYLQSKAAAGMEATWRKSMCDIQVGQWSLPAAVTLPLPPTTHSRHIAV